MNLIASIILFKAFIIKFASINRLKNQLKFQLNFGRQMTNETPPVRGSVFPLGPVRPSGDFPKRIGSPFDTTSTRTFRLKFDTVFTKD